MHNEKEFEVQRWTGTTWTAVGTAVRSATTKTVINQSDGTQTFRVVPRVR